jgi:hypothetical protein
VVEYMPSKFEALKFKTSRPLEIKKMARCSGSHLLSHLLRRQRSEDQKKASEVLSQPTIQARWYVSVIAVTQEL